MTSESVRKLVISELAQTKKKHDNMTLEEELYIKVLEYGANEATIKIQSSTKWFALARTINAQRNELLRWATFFLPTIGGSLIVFTRMGVKTHHDAIQCGIGGQIIGLVF